MQAPSSRSKSMSIKMFPALSVQQPFADLIVDGKKDVENRTRWSRFRGYLLIHAPGTVRKDSVDAHRKQLGLGRDDEYTPETGAILGLVEITDAVLEHKSRWFEPGHVAVL